MSGIDGRLLEQFTQGINAPEGAEDAGKFVMVNAEGNNFIFVAPEELPGGGGTTLPDGTYDGQPLMWEDGQWQPVLPGNWLRIWGIREVDDFTALTVRSENSSGLMLDCRHPSGRVTVQAVGSLHGSSLEVTPDGLAMFMFDNYLMQAYYSGEPRLAFFGANPIARQAITGATTQDQIDSLVAALVGLGLVTDGR